MRQHVHSYHPAKHLSHFLSLYFHNHRKHSVQTPEPNKQPDNIHAQINAFYRHYLPAREWLKDYDNF